MSKTKTKSKRGFASMKDKTRLEEICRKGGIAVSQNKEYMATIGRIGGLKSVEARRNKKLLKEGL